VIRPAVVDDVPRIVELIVELATYEREAASAQATAEQLREALFGPDPAVFCLVAEQDAGADGAAGGEVVGFALWFLNFSTWLGRHGIYLEDLFVSPAARRAGHGRALLVELARIARERGYGRLEWSVLDWNTPAQEFYAALGAAPMQEWTTWRVTGSALTDLAADAAEGHDRHR
jgi:GNAT superfamily N-acetyltransferase